MKKINLYIVMFMLIIASCSKQSNDTNNPDDTSNGSTGAITEAGYGASNKPFTSPAWSLPAGVELADSIHEYSYCWAFDPYTNVPQKDWKGVPVGFPFCLSLSNTTNAPITILFPPELVFVSSSAEHQNVLVIDMGAVQIAPGIITTIVAQGFCLNKGRTIPQTYVDETERFLTYSFGPSQLPAALKEVATIVESKHFTMNDVLKADGTVDNTKIEKFVPIQSAIWEVTDESGLTNATKEKLKAL